MSGSWAERYPRLWALHGAPPQAPGPDWPAVLAAAPSDTAREQLAWLRARLAEHQELRLEARDGQVDPVAPLAWQRTNPVVWAEVTLMVWHSGRAAVAACLLPALEGK